MLDEPDTMKCKNKCGSEIPTTEYYAGDGFCCNACRTEYRNASRLYNHPYAKEDDPLNRFNTERGTDENVGFGHVLRITAAEREELRKRAERRKKEWDQRNVQPV